MLSLGSGLNNSSIKKNWLNNGNNVQFLGLGEAEVHGLYIIHELDFISSQTAFYNFLLVFRHS